VKSTQGDEKMSEPGGSPKDTFKQVFQIGAVVRDLDKSVKVLSEVFGIGPFNRIEDWPPSDRPDYQLYYYGEPGDFTARMAFVDLGQVELELIQPLEGKSIWSDFLEEHGEGIHHIRFNTPDHEPVIEYLAQNGIGVSQMGSGLRPGTFWVNFDTEDKVGFTIEIMKALPGTSGKTPKIVGDKAQS
jgi:catechol 2,3-dioxygenase-like lactoylglutathione lyase family enzyme